MKRARIEPLKDILILLAALLVMAAIVLPFQSRHGGEGEFLPAVRTVSGDGIIAENGRVLIDINTAGTDLLMSLPGVGDVLAQRIIAHREAHGPFGSVDDLVGVNGIGPATLERLRPEIGVSRP